MDYHILVEMREWGVFAVDCAILYWIIKEFYFDKSIYEKKSVKIRRNKRGNLEITEQSRGVDVVIQQSGEGK